MMRWLMAFLVLGTIGFGLAADPMPPKFLDQLQTQFPRWDRNRDGVLSSGEIELTVADPEVRGSAAAVAATLRRAVHSKTSQLPSLTLSTIRESIPRPKGSKAIPDFEGMYISASKRIAQPPRELFAAELITLDSLHQGKLGNCYCLAPLASMLHRNPQQVAAMFQPEQDGRIKVTFGGMKSVYVTPLTDAERALLADNDDDGIWVNIYEKAIGECRLAQTDDEDRPTALSVVGKGGSAGTTLQLITGHAIRRFSCKPWQSETPLDSEKSETLLSELRKELLGTFGNRRLVVGGTKAEVKVPGITSSHAYAILSYDAKRDTVRLWNPHGQTFRPKGSPGVEYGYPTTKGEFDVPLTEIVHWFGGFSFETDQPSN